MSAPTGFRPVNSQSSYLPIEFDLPEDSKTASELISKRERLTASVVNTKESGIYQNVETLTGQQWFSTRGSGEAKQERSSFRTVVDFGPLPNNTTIRKAHNIPVNNKTIFTSIYGVGNNPNVRSIPLPYINTTTPGSSVELFVDPTYVNITTTTDYSAYTTTYVVLEYIKG